MKTILMAGAMALLLSGCANFTSPARSSALTSNTAYWLDYDATRRGALVLPHGVNMKTCAEPAPDVALSLVSKLEASSKPGADADGKERIAKAEFNSTVVDLAKRTQTVAFLRESLFRLCEQSLNNTFTKEQVIDAYKVVIAVAQKIAEADAKDAEAKASLNAAVLRMVEKGSGAGGSMELRLKVDPPAPQ